MKPADLVIEGLRAGRQPYDGSDPASSTDAINDLGARTRLTCLRLDIQRA